MKLQLVDPVQWWPQASALAAEHWAETGVSGSDLAPDLSLYQALHAQGMLFAIAGTVGGSLVAYLMATVCKHDLAAREVWASNRALFVSSQYRGSLGVGRMILMAEDEARKRGATAFVWGLRAGSAAVGVFSERRGYQPLDVSMIKRF